MLENEVKQLYRRYKSDLRLFFKEQFSDYDEVKTGFRSGNIVTDEKLLLSYLQTAFFDEKICEIHLGNPDDIYFCRVWDHAPEQEGVFEDGDEEFAGLEYEPGDYLVEFDRIITSPLEPGLGNFRIVSSEQIVMRIATTTFAVDLGTYYREKIDVDGLPMLQLDFPTIGVIQKSAREYRVKVISSYDITVRLVIGSSEEAYATRPLDVSIHGMAIVIEKEHRESLQIDYRYNVEIAIPNEDPIKVTCIVRHLSKVRDKKKIMHMCGLSFVLDDKVLAAQLEKLIATLQRAHLQELSEKSYELGIDLL